MTPVWEAARQHATVEIPDAEFRGRASVELGVPVEQVWDHLINPDFRRILVGSDRQELESDVRRRMGEGDVYQRYQGDQVVPSVILEWVPFARIVSRDLIHVPEGRVELTVDYTLVPTDTGTTLGLAAARPGGTVEEVAGFDAVWPEILEAMNEGLRSFKEIVEAQVAAAGSSAG